MYLFLSILLGAFIVQLAFWFLFFRRLAFHREQSSDVGFFPEGISLIICAKNESMNLRRHLPLILTQEFSPFELIVVDDNSTDDSVEVLLDFQKKSKNLRIIQIKAPTLPGKKQALARGIAEAKYRWLLLTDADAVPTGKQWIGHMCAAVAKNTGIVLGYGPYMAEKGWLNLFIRFEALWVAVQYLSFALRGMPYMGVGRNLMYEKPLFTNSGGFRSHENLASGDDDLFVREVASAHNTRICIDAESFVYSRAKNNLRAYFLQKSRHLSTANRYRLHHKLLLGALSMSHFLFFIGVMISLFTSFWVWGLCLYVLRLIVAWPLFARIASRLKDPQAGRWFPVFDMGMLLFYVVFTPPLFFKRYNNW